VEGNNPHGGHRRICEGDRDRVRVSHGIVEVKLLCCRWLSIYIYTHTHTHICMYVCIYIYIYIYIKQCVSGVKDITSGFNSRADSESKT
jgi:hypothetical protein